MGDRLQGTNRSKLTSAFLFPTVAEEVINVIKPPCVCDREGTATVNLEWGLIPVLLGWYPETVKYNVVVTSQSEVQQLKNAVSPLQIPLLLDNENYVFEITASNECGEISEPKVFSEVIDCESE